MSNNLLKYMDYDGNRYAYADPKEGEIWEIIDSGFKKIDKGELPDKVKGQIIKEMI